MYLQQLQYVVEVANCKSITEASKKLFISQPGLSSAIHDLENELGIEIFKRAYKGITVTNDGIEFLSYARQVVEQTNLLEYRYKNKLCPKKICSISTQHYSFSVTAFSNLIKKFDNPDYEFTLKETRTYEIIKDVADFRSEIGILYINDFNKNIIKKLINENELEFYPLFTAEPHIFISSKHPLADKSMVDLQDLEEYPFLCFEQGTHNAFFFSEEILSTIPRKKVIHVSDRATLFNLLIGLNGYTICTGLLNSNLNGDNIISVPLNAKDSMQVGYIVNSKLKLSDFALDYIQELKKIIEQGQA
ncbi:MAG: LysR family transcriptional regulator [Oscillospiraceae bacterium]